MLDYLILKQLFELWHHQNILANHDGSFPSTRYHGKTNMVICPLWSKTQCLSTETITVYPLLSKDGRVRWHAETVMVTRFRCSETIKVPFIIQRQASPMVCGDEDGHPCRSKASKIILMMPKIIKDPFKQD